MLLTNKVDALASAMTYRNDPILPVVAAGEPVEEDHTVTGTSHAAQALYDLREQGVPATMCWATLEAAFHFLVVTVAQSWRQQMGLNAAQLCQKVGQIVYDSKTGFGIPRIILLEDDVDASNTNEVIWAFATRSHPGRDIVFNHEPMNPIPIFLDSKERHSYRSTKVVHNCLSQDEWTPETAPRRTSFKELWPAEIQQRVLNNWAKYGYR